MRPSASILWDVWVQRQVQTSLKKGRGGEKRFPEICGHVSAWGGVVCADGRSSSPGRIDMNILSLTGSTDG